MRITSAHVVALRYKVLLEAPENLPRAAQELLCEIHPHHKNIEERGYYVRLLVTRYTERYQ